MSGRPIFLVPLPVVVRAGEHSLISAFTVARVETDDGIEPEPACRDAREVHVIAIFPEDIGRVGEIEEIRESLRPHLPKDAALQSVFCEAPASADSSWC